MPEALIKTIPFFLADDQKSFWGLTRLMSPDQLLVEENHYKSPHRNKSFICSSVGRGTKVYFLSGAIDIAHPEFSRAQVGQVFLNSQTTAVDSRATGLASLIVGECFGVASEAHLVNVVCDQHNILQAFEYCRAAAQDDPSPSVISLAFEINKQIWSTVEKTVKDLKSKGVHLIIPATSNYGEAIGVAATDINDKVLGETNSLAADLLAPGVKVAALDPIEKLPQILSGHDVAVAFATSVSLIHLTHIRPAELKKHLTVGSEKNVTTTQIPLLWNPYQIFEPTWDYNQDAFLGVWSWGQKIEIPLKLLNAGSQKFEIEFVHSDLPPTIEICGMNLVGQLSDGAETRCYHFVVKAKNGQAEASKMFYITVTDVPEMIDPENYQNLNIVAKVMSHYLGSPSPPAFPPYHSIAVTCLSPKSLISVCDDRKFVEIQDLIAGDYILNSGNQESKVLQVMQVSAKDRRIFSVNSGLIVLTSCHRLVTTSGVAAIDYKNEVDLDQTPLVELKVGSHLICSNGKTVTVNSLEEIKTDFEWVYNVVTDNDSGYIANGILCATEIFTEQIFKRSPQIKGDTFLGVFKKEHLNGNF